MSKIPMTVQGASQLRVELQHLKSQARPQVIAAISEARKHGDLSENAEYHAAKEQQSFIEGRIQEIESKLSNAQVIDLTNVQNNGKVVFGSIVHLMNVDNEQTMHYHIVGEDEADIKSNKISFTAPIARAVIAKQEGDVVHVQTPNGEVSYEIIEVNYQ